MGGLGRGAGAGQGLRAVRTNNTDFLFWHVYQPGASSTCLSPAPSAVMAPLLIVFVV